MNLSLAVEMRGITKRFPGVLANDRVDFDVRRGEVHALLGENGAGKSTLMNILYGLYRPDRGEILWQGRPVQFRSPHDAIALGIGMVHQTFQLVPTLTVAQNVVLGLRSRRGPFYDAADAEARIRDLSQRYGLTLDPRARVDRLDVGTQQRVEIIKALYRRVKLLILDEPTSVLTPKETQDLIVVLRRLVSEEHSVVFISHKLDEVMQVSDRVTVLRDGRVVGTSPCCDTNPRELAVMMVGRQLPELMAKTPVGDSPAATSQHGVMLRLEGVSALSEQRLPVLRDVTLQVRAGEIVGVAGVAGNGQHELAEVIAGLHPVSAGRILLRGREITRCSPRTISEQGVAYVPENPRQLCIFPDFTLEQNAILKTYRQAPLARGGFILDGRRIEEYTRQLMGAFDVRAPGPKTLARQLSGGNLQRLVLARELSREPTVIVSAQPTVGLDVIATLYIRQRLLEQRARGCAILLVSADLDEVIRLSDRVVVMYEGQVVGELSAEQINVEELGLMMAGAGRGARVSL